MTSDNAAFVIYGWPWLSRAQLTLIPLPPLIAHECNGDICDYFDAQFDEMVTIFDSGNGHSDQRLMYLGVDIASTFTDTIADTFTIEQLLLAQEHLILWCSHCPPWLKEILAPIIAQPPKYYLIMNEG